MTVLGGIQARFQACDQMDRVSMRHRVGMLSSGRQDQKPRVTGRDSRQQRFQQVVCRTENLRVRRRLMTMTLEWLAAVLAAVDSRLAVMRARYNTKRWQALGMRIGRDVVLPPSTTVDVSHCYVISIGDRCSFGPQCLILAHDAQMDEFLDAGRLGRVVIGEGCRIGARCVILCNVEIGAGSIVEAGSVVATSLPPGSYCAGSPARVVCSAAEYAQRIAQEASGRPRYTTEALRERLRRPEARKALWEELARGTVLVDRADAAGLAPADDRALRP